MDILEAPQLMDTCVRNGNYDDALDLRAFVAKLLLIHPGLKVRHQKQPAGLYREYRTNTSS